MVCTDEEGVAATVEGCLSETDRRVHETEQFPGRRACKARTEMDDGSGGLARTADGCCCGVRARRKKGNNSGHVVIRRVARGG